MADLTRHEIPPGGWQFLQPQTGWWAPTPVASTFDQTVQLIIRHRLANGPIAAKFNLSIDPERVGNELEQYTRLRLGIPAISSPPKPVPSLPLPLAGEAVADIKKAAQGTAVVLDWLMSGGKPVEQDLANKRAAVCVSCPRNVPGRWFTTAPAELIRSTLSARSDLKLETPVDDKLQSCDVCKCLMRLKVWTPLQYILEKTKPATLAEFPSHCWIAKRDQ